MCCVIEADNRNKGDSSQTEEQVIDLYIGIFFDGTNNNKIQVALGKRYRRDEILKEIIRKLNKGEYSREQEEFLIEKNIIGSRKIKVKRIIQQPGAMPTVAYLPVDDVTYKNFLNPRTFKSTKELIAEKYYVEYSIIKNGNVLMSVDREEWENENIKGILTQSQLDQLYYGYDKDDKDNYFIEKRISNQLDLVDHSGRIDEGSHNIGWDRSEKTERFTFASTSKKNNVNLREEIESYINEDDTIKGDSQTQYYSPAQNPTYTNVAILESLYDASILFNGNDNGNKYFSIYVEGSGSDMVFKPGILGGIHVAGPGLFGLGKGTGDTGVVAKVMKMTRQIKHILEGIPNTKNIYFDVFGFSRGATEARILNYLINPRNDIYLEQKLISTNITNINDYQRFTGSPNVFLKDNKIKHKEVRFLGIYDTVSSIGVFPEGLLTSNIKVGIVNDIGLKMANLDFIFNKIPDTVSRLKDNVFAWLVRLLYEKTINHPEEMAMTILTGFSPDFFTMNHRAGTEEILNQILAKFPVDQVSDQKWAIKVVEYLRDGIKSIRVNFVEPWEKYAKEQYLECIEEPNISIFGKSKYHNKNVKDYGLFATNEAQEVFHICALDEVRTNFALVDIESSVNSNGLELFIPGCHTDIGGGIGIGRDDQRIANISAFNGTPNFVCKTRPFDKKEMEYVPMSTEGLMLAGWIDTMDERVKGSYLRNVPTKSELIHDVSVYTDNTNSWLHTPNIIMSRNVKPGYSNIGLHLMHGRANKEELKRMFNDIPLAYKVPDDLEDYYKKIHSRVINTEKGRLFVNPSSGLYRELRHDWLHFSANEQIVSIADNLIVNPPYYVGAYLNDNKIPAEERIVLKGSEISFDGQKHTIRKVGSNIINMIKQPTSRILPFPFNAKAPFQITALTDAMISSRIIYKGEEDDEFEKGKPKRTYLFDYNSTQSLINLSLKDSKYNKDLDKYIALLLKRKKRAESFVIMCRDMQEALNKVKDEEMFHINNNATKLCLNQISIKTKTTRIKKTMAGLLFVLDFGDTKGYAKKVISMNMNGNLSVGDLSEKFLEFYMEELRRKNNYDIEASNAFIDGYTEIRDSLTALVPNKLYAKHWASWFFVNAPELGKLFGHTAGLIHVYRKVADWKKQEEFGHMTIRVLDKQIEMIKRDMKK